MSYTEISSRRIPYDIDGTVVGYCRGSSNIITNWASSTVVSNLNKEGTSNLLQVGDGPMSIWFFFPEKIELENMYVGGMSDYDQGFYIVNLQGSNDTTNGNDGTWETATFPSGSPAVNNPNIYSWRTNIKPVSFSTSYKVIRLMVNGNGNYDPIFKCINIYGRKASGETPDDIMFCDIEGNELSALNDWGDRPEGTTVIESFKVKNASTTKIANGVNLQLNHSDFALSFSESGPWTATLDITSIAANSLSATIYVRNLLGPPLLTLGPKAARCIATVGSWT